jgi:hypothetical protein
MVKRDVADRVHRPHREGALGGGPVQLRGNPIVGELQRAAQVPGL